MKKLSINGKFYIINLLINLLLIGTPLIIFGCFNVFPTIKSTTILYWVSFGLFPLINIGWFTYSLFKKSNEASISFLNLILNYSLLLVPFINMIFALIPMDHIALFVVPLLFDILVLITYVSLTLLLSHAGNKMEASIQNNKSEKNNPKSIDDFMNKDGTFKGSNKGE